MIALIASCVYDDGMMASGQFQPGVEHNTCATCRHRGKVENLMSTCWHPSVVDNNYISGRAKPKYCAEVRGVNEPICDKWEAIPSPGIFQRLRGWFTENADRLLVSMLVLAALVFALTLICLS